MGKKGGKNICLWIVRENAKVTKVRLTYFTISLFAIFCALFGGAFVLVTGDYARVQVLRLKNFVMLKKAENERDNAVDEKSNLQSEVSKLRYLNSKVMAYEQDVRQKLGQLGQMLESATSLGVVEEDQNSATAEPLEGGVGGSEIDCTGDFGNKNYLTECKANLFSPSAYRGNLANQFFLGQDQHMASLSMKKWQNSIQEVDDDLPNRLDKYIAFLRGLPLATPAYGRLTSGFGFRISPFTRHLSLHEGIDISLTSGAPIKSAGVGVVKQVGNNGTYGLMVDVEHSDHLITRYAHLSKAMVQENDKVNMGDLVGLAGSTGRSTGPHLHYEVRVDGRAKNPKNFMNLVHSLRSLL